MSYYNRQPHFLDNTVLRLNLVIGCIILFGIGIIFRLFFLQVIEHDKFSRVAKRQHLGGFTITPKRGEILTKDIYSDTYFKLATNISLNLLYVDPTLIKDRKYTAQLLAPFVLTEKDYQLCIDKPEECIIDYKNEATDINNEELEKSNTDIITAPSYEELLKLTEKHIYNKISQDEIIYRILKREVDEQTFAKIKELTLPGIIIDHEKNIIAVNPTQIPADDIKRLSFILEPIIKVKQATIMKKMKRTKRQYVPLKRKLSNETSEQINKIKQQSRLQSLKNSVYDPLRGIGLQSEHWRYYPNNSLAAQILGFFNNNNIEIGGQYGLEEAFDSELMGKEGQISADTDPNGNAITFGEGDIKNVINGKNIVLTIDPPIQSKVEEILEKKVKEYKAVSAQVIIMNPFTGGIIAMANYPSFNPNDYSTVYEKEKIPKWDKIPDYITVFVKEDDKFRFATKDEHNNYEIDRYRYINKIGPGVFRNKIIQDIYEPGSVFKPITMAIALDRHEVTPQTKYYDTGVVKTGEFIYDKEIEIHNANNKSYGWVNMTNCLEDSINTCMSFIAQKLGTRFYAPLFYKYIRDFGFGEYTDIELISEEKGKVKFWDTWTKTELMTTSFGQGISATPLQVVTAWSALANGGIMVQPHIIDAMIDTNGEITKTETKIVKRVISQEASSTITAMLVSTVQNGVAAPGQVEGYKLAGKTGTSQIAKKNSNGYEIGEGSSITSFAGYAPVQHPKFVMLVKFDRPRFGRNSTWGSTTAAPTFKEIAKFLFEYYNIPPDN